MPAVHPASSTARLIGHIVSAWRTQAIHAAVQLRFPDHLAAKPLTPQALAAATECDASAAERLLRALCVLGVCRERNDGRFSLTRSGRMLCEEGDGGGNSLRPLAEWWGGPLWPVWQNLGYSVKTGRSAREELLGEKDYRYLEHDARLADTFHGAMRATTALVANDVAAWHSWKEITTVVDIGGGHGQLLLAVLAAHVHLRGVVFDTETARQGALMQIEFSGFADRVSFEGGDFFATQPEGADCYVLKSILHNWNDERCATILSTCRRAVPRHARLLIVERVRPVQLKECQRDEGVARTDLNMLAGLGGRERTFEEYAELLEGAGFFISGSYRTMFEFTLIEARVSHLHTGSKRCA